MILRPCISKLAVAALAALLTSACNYNNAPRLTVTQPATTAANVNATTSATDARRLSDGANRLIEAMNKPVAAFHFSFKAQEKISPATGPDKSLKPVVGPVRLEADVTPLELNLIQKQGGTVQQTHARLDDEMNWKMAHLAILGVMTNPNLVIAVGSHAAEPPGNDLVGSMMADRYSFDTTAATADQKRAFDLARPFLPSIQACKGTAWIAKGSGELVKFNVDADYLDQNGHAWKEHYEGLVVPKP